MSHDAELLQYVRYVPHELRAAYEAIGWVWVADMPWHHSAWSVLMMWRGEGEPREP
jgi:hypothetical protein